MNDKQNTINYAEAPITEAIIDIRCDTLDVDIEVFREISNLTLKTHPIVEDLFEREIKVSLEEVEDSKLLKGIRCESKDNIKIYQASKSGLTVNHLAPYTNWKTLLKDMQDNWHNYIKLIPPVKITRLAVRYINKVDIPLPLSRFEDYLRTYPKLSEDLPQNIDDFFMKFEIDLPEVRARMSITQAVVNSADKNKKSIVLDIDVFCTENVPQKNEDIWLLFEKLRQEKNKAFEACITNITREGFK